MGNVISWGRPFPVGSGEVISGRGVTGSVQGRLDRAGSPWRVSLSIKISSKVHSSPAHPGTLQVQDPPNPGAAAQDLISVVVEGSELTTVTLSIPHLPEIPWVFFFQLLLDFSCPKFPPRTPNVPFQKYLQPFRNLSQNSAFSDRL